MSWDVYIVADTGGPELAIVEDVRNVTYNNSSLFSALNVHPDNVPKECSYWIVPLELALKELRESRSEYERLEPSNNWGGIDDSIDFLSKLLWACRCHPKAEVRWG